MSNTVVPDGVVVVLANKGGGATAHETQSQEELARHVARLKGYRYAGRYDAACNYGCPVYFVPGETVTSIPAAHRIGVHGEHDLFGGVVPYAYVATKTITHALAGPDAAAPAGWSPRFGEMVADVVLPGISAFSLGDARVAGRALLEKGAVRVKMADGIGGAGQSVARDVEQLESQLAVIEAAGGFAAGVVLERNLREVETFSVGQVRIGDDVASYYGRQRLTHNNRGDDVYGGSDLTVVRGDYPALLQLDLPPPMKLAISQAMTYHTAALACFDGMFVSRSNYDIAQGPDCEGTWRSGVLEQSWRAGGASGAELAALEAFRAHPHRFSVRASTVELYGDGHEPPEDAVVYFRGHDARVGPLIKYARLNIDADS